MPRVLTAPVVADLIRPTLSAQGVGPAYLRLTEALRHAIADGRLPEGSRLPSERDLPGPLGLSRTTITRAYAELRSQGYLRTRRGSGSLVQVPHVPGGRIDHLLTPSALGEGVLDLTCTAAAAPPGTSEAYQDAVEDLGAYLPGTGYYPGGLPVLREVLADRFTARGLATSPEQVIVAPGALAGVAIAARALLSRRERVLVETPTYPNAIATLEGAGARTVAHPVDHVHDDWQVTELTRALRSSGARTAYLIPDFHNPTGALMPAEQRRELGRVMRALGVVPIVDESIVDLPLDGQPVPEPLGRHVPDSVTVGSVSKSLWGGLRVGWLRVPRARAEEMAASRLKLDLGVPVLEQLVAARLLQDAPQILARQQARLREGREIVLAGLREHLPDWRVRVPRGGMALWCALPASGSTALATAARRYDVALAAGPNFAAGGGLDGWIRLPYVLSPEQLGQVAPRLALAWADVLAGRVEGGRDARGEEARRIIA
ncbi:PLP-dependent aminotransferase family protein [Serinicoccus kebangsaanensis]|uniref:MocR-like transcription factor YczR n=1 Tax=Serinicoccus kebangsaanensis TaxID=2602069 RepID=UPI001EE306EE|nr:PLP-dependent aminotransferase family protein [Serinicoccus kebangsaanensis]